METAKSVLKKINESINAKILLEDDMTNLTGFEILNKLGTDGFKTWLSDSCYNIIKQENINFLSNMKVYHAFLQGKAIYLAFSEVHNNYEDILLVTYLGGGVIEVKCRVYSKKYFVNGIPSEETESYKVGMGVNNVYNNLSKAIKQACYNSTMRDLRQKIDTMFR